MRLGLELDQTRGMEYNPLTQRYWLSDDTSVNYLFATRMTMTAISRACMPCCSIWTAH